MRVNYSKNRLYARSKHSGKGRSYLCSLLPILSQRVAHKEMDAE